MNSGVIGLGLVLSSCLSSAALAQETITGKYVGSFEQTSFRGNSSNQGLTLDITSVQGRTVKGTAIRAGGRHSSCTGEYPIAGTLKGNELVLKSVEAGNSSGDCNLKLNLTVNGSKLVGTMGKLKVELSK